MIRSLTAWAVLAVSLTGCTKVPDSNALQRKTEDYWRTCSLVKVTDFKVVSASNSVVRYSYNLEVKKNGVDVSASDCERGTALTLEALANEDIGKLKSGAKIDVIQELRFDAT